MARVIHFEIHADNLERVRSFYTAVLGWEFTQQWMGGPVEYWLIKTGPDDEPGIDGGLLKRQDAIGGNAPTAYVCTADVPSVDDAVALVTRHGGEIALPKMAVDGVGWLAYAKDTEGNIFGMLQADPKAASAH